MTAPQPPGAATSVACLSVSAALGGSEWSLLDFARRAGANGIRALVILPRDGPLGEQLKQAGVAVAIAPAPESFLALTQRTMLSMAGLVTLSAGVAKWSRAIYAEAHRFFGHSPAILYTNGFKAHLASTLVRGPHRVWHLREFPPDQIAAMWKLLARAVPTRAIANSKAVADAWYSTGLRPDVVYNGVDLQLFQPGARSGWIHRQLDLPPEARLIGMPAIFARWKGHLQVVEAFERVAEQVPEAHLVLVGGAIYDTTAERGFAEELVKRVGRSSMSGGGARKLNDRIHFLRHSAEPWKLYPEFDVAVHFSTRPEPFGRVVAEALASGVPPIAARAGGPVEIVEEGVCGWLVAPGDVAALAQVMTRALATMAGTGAETIRQACRQRAESMFSADRYASEVAAILRGVGSASS